MKRFVLVYLFLCSALFAFSNDFYRVKSGTVNARSWASTSSDVICTYKQGEVLSISEYFNQGNYRWGKVAGSYPAQWVAVSNLKKMSQEEINQYFISKTKVANQPEPEPKSKSKRERVTHDSFSIFILLKVLIVIYAFAFFILLYNEAKDRKKISTHAAYGVCCIMLLFWIFFSGKWQWLWVGFMWAGLCYPLAYAKFVEKNGYISGLLEFGALLLCGISTWYFLRKCDLITEYVGYLNGFEVAAMVGVNLVISGAFGIAYIMNRCPICNYFCAPRKVDTRYDGSSYYDVAWTKTKEYWDHRDVEEGAGNTIRIIDYYRREKTRTTSTYRREYHTTTYHCPHCNNNYQIQSYIDYLVHRKVVRF